MSTKKRCERFEVAVKNDIDFNKNIFDTPNPLNVEF